MWREAPREEPPMSDAFAVEYRIVNRHGKAFYASEDWIDVQITAAAWDDDYPDCAPHRIEMRTVCPWVACETPSRASEGGTSDE